MVFFLKGGDFVSEPAQFYAISYPRVNGRNAFSGLAGDWKINPLTAVSIRIQNVHTL